MLLQSGVDLKALEAAGFVSEHCTTQRVVTGTLDVLALLPLHIHDNLQRSSDAKGGSGAGPDDEKRQYVA